jgi:hypothetical protein
MLEPVQKEFASALVTLPKFAHHFFKILLDLSF